MTKRKSDVRKQSHLEDILDFCVDLTRRMIVSGANLERVQLALEQICHAYDLTDLSLFLISTHISVGARDEEGRYASRQGSIPPAGIHLERLKALNRLSYTVVSSLSNPYLLVPLSFAASVCFGVVFRIPPHDLWRAGLGGALTRLVLVILTAMRASRLVYITLAATCAALYAELMATRRRDPSTYFVYPSIVPLIPGDLFYYSLVGVYMGDRAMFEMNGLNCLLVLICMSFGFVLSSIIAHYVRRGRHRKRVDAQPLE